MIVVNEHFSSLSKFSAWAQSGDPQTYGWIAVALVLAIVYVSDRYARRDRRSRHRPRQSVSRSYRESRPGVRNPWQSPPAPPIELDRSKPLPVSAVSPDDAFLVIASDNTPAGPDPTQKPISPALQMEAVAAVDFERVKLLNSEEARLLPILEAIARDCGKGYRVMAQTSLGEILRPKDDSATPTIRNAAYASINSKRLDFAIFDRRGFLVAAV